MSHRKSLAALAGLAVLLAARPAAAEDKKPARLDFTKRVAVENRTEALVKALSGAAPPRAEAAVNPKVAPGKVKWHASLAAACAAARKSGKPVLLFQLMGKLADQFC